MEPASLIWAESLVFWSLPFPIAFRPAGFSYMCNVSGIWVWGLSERQETHVGFKEETGAFSSEATHPFKKCFCLFFENFIHAYNVSQLNPRFIPPLQLAPSQNLPNVSLTTPHPHLISSFSKLSHINVAHMYMGLGPSTGAWQTYPWPHLEEKGLTTIATISSSGRGGTSEACPSIQVEIMPRLILRG